VVLHEEGNDIAAGAAPETVKNALLRGHREGRLGLRVERAQPRKISPLLRQLDILAHHLLDRGSVFDLQELVFRDKSHVQLPVVSGQWPVVGRGKPGPMRF
jgi:hypothetical protein